VWESLTGIISVRLLRSHPLERRGLVYSRREVVPSEMVKVMVRKERKGRRAIDRINGRLSFIHMQ
jgi:hypothetical protein